MPARPAPAPTDEAARLAALRVLRRPRHPGRGGLRRPDPAGGTDLRDPDGARQPGGRRPSVVQVQAGSGSGRDTSGHRFLRPRHPAGRSAGRAGRPGGRAIRGQPPGDLRPPRALLRGLAARHQRRPGPGDSLCARPGAPGADPRAARGPAHPGPAGRRAAGAAAQGGPAPDGPRGARAGRAGGARDPRLPDRARDVGAPPVRDAPPQDARVGGRPRRWAAGGLGSPRRPEQGGRCAARADGLPRPAGRDGDPPTTGRPGDRPARLCRGAGRPLAPGPRRARALPGIPGPGTGLRRPGVRRVRGRIHGAPARPSGRAARGRRHGAGSPRRGSLPLGSRPGPSEPLPGGDGPGPGFTRPHRARGPRLSPGGGRRPRGSEGDGVRGGAGPRGLRGTGRRRRQRGGPRGLRRSAGELRDPPLRRGRDPRGPRSASRPGHHPRTRPARSRVAGPPRPDVGSSWPPPPAASPWSSCCRACS